MKTLISCITLCSLSTFAVADTKAPDPAKKAPDAKKNPGTDLDRAAPAMPAMPKPDAKIAEIAKMIAGTWRCTGKSMMDPSKPDASIPVKATITNKMNTDLGKWWLQTTFNATMGKETYKFTAFTTYNGLTKKWHRYMIDNMGGAGWNTSTGPAAGKLIWEGESVGQMAGTEKVKERHTEDMTDPKNVKMSGEVSMDGKTWMPVYDMTCKK